MIQLKNIYIPVVVAVMLLTSCIKETTDTSKYYYGKLNVKQIPMPDAATLDLYVNGQFADSVLTSGNYAVVEVPAEQELSVAVYRKGTKELVADTVLTIPRNQNAVFRVVSSPAFGMSGVVPVETVHADSVKLQLIGNWNTAIYPYSKLDVYIYDYIGNKLGSLTAVVEGVETGKMYPKPITLYHTNEAKTGGFIYIFKLWDPISQQFIKQKANSTEIFVLVQASLAYNGFLSYAQITDSGEPVANRISCKLTIVN